jgi:branched-chain amino acid transport system permease protein
MSVPLLLDLLILTLIWAGIAGAWNLLAGFAGQFSLGHAAFIGIGAYAAAVPAVRYQISPWVGMLGGMVLAGLLALFVASISLRMRGPFFTLLTIAFSEVVRLIALYAKALTNGAEGIIIELQPGLTNLYFLEKWPFVVLASLYAFGMYLLCAAVRRSRIGHRLLALRDDEDAARSLGVAVYRARVVATVISAAFASVGGALLAMYTQYIDPDSTLSFLLSVELSLITIVGGLGNAAGPFVGAFLIVPLERILRSWFGGVLFGLHGLLFGTLLIVILLAAPNGVLSVVENWRTQWAQRRHA